MAKVRDLTKGNIGKELILFAIPMLLSSLVQQLYNTVDLIYAGNFLGKSATASIGASSLLITCLVGFFGGMSVGSGVVVSQIYGARDEEKLKKAVHNAVALCLAGGLLFMLLGVVFAPLYLRLINTPWELQAGAVSYLCLLYTSGNPHRRPERGKRDHSEPAEGTGRKETDLHPYFPAPDCYRRL